MADGYDRFENEGNGGGSFMMGLLTGTVLGAGLGMLFAPKAGAELRNQLSEQAGNLASQAQDGIRKVQENAPEWVERGKDIYGKAKDAVAKGADDAQKYVRDAAGTVKDTAAKTADDAKSYVRDTTNAVKDSAAKTADEAKSYVRDTTNAVKDVASSASHAYASGVESVRGAGSEPTPHAPSSSTGGPRRS